MGNSGVNVTVGLALGHSSEHNDSSPEAGGKGRQSESLQVC